MFSCTGRECSQTGSQQKPKQLFTPPASATHSPRQTTGNPIGKLNDSAQGDPSVQPEQPLLAGNGTGLEKTSVPLKAQPKSSPEDELAVLMKQYADMASGGKNGSKTTTSMYGSTGNTNTGTSQHPKDSDLDALHQYPKDGDSLAAQVQKNTMRIETMQQWKDVAHAQLQSVEPKLARCCDVADSTTLKIDGMTLKIASLELKLVQHQDVLETMARRLQYLESEPPLPSDEVANRQPHPASIASASEGRLSKRESKVFQTVNSQSSSGVNTLQETVKRVELDIALLKAQQFPASDLQDSNHSHRVSNLEKTIEEIKAQQHTIQALQIELESVANKEKMLEDNMTLNRSNTTHELHELDQKVLDKGEMYMPNESIWDMALFVGLPYIGIGISIIIGCVLMFNIVLQLWFSQIIWTYMLEGPVDADFLTHLLRFRASVAHNADYADKLARRSMISQICTGDDTLHLSYGQFSTNQDMQQFYDGAMPLSVLTIVCWLIKVLGEASEATQFCRMVWSIRRSTSTRVMTDIESLQKSDRISKHMKDGLLDVMAAEQAAALLKIDVVVRLMTLTFQRAIYAFVFIGFPRLILAIALGYIGVSYLSITSRMEDLLLNGMALAFISDIDEIIYVLFVPRRAKTFIGNLEPLPVTFQPLEKFHRLPWFNSAAKLVIVTILTLIIIITFTIPFFDKLHQAIDIICSGDTNFIASNSKATGMTHATRSQQNSDWTPSDFAVLQLARPLFMNLSFWEIDERVLAAIDSPIKHAVVEPSAYSLGTTTDASSFDFVVSLSSLSVDQSDFLTCEDMSAGQSYDSTLARLRSILRNESIRGCREDQETIWQFCPKMNMIELRSICPQTCGCGQVFPQNAGFFAHPAWGCPSACASASKAKEGYQYDQGLQRPCSDTQPPVFFIDVAFKRTGVDEEIMFRWFTNYIQGLFEYLLDSAGFVDLVASNAADAAKVGFFNVSDVETIVAHATSGEMANTILSGSWDIAPGVPHGRGYKGCDYLTSTEVSYLLGINFCDDSNFWSLRSICPVSCSCGAFAGCPLSCARQDIIYPCTNMQDGSFLEAQQATISWLINQPGVQDCEQNESAVQSLCSLYDYNILRQICPLSCHCERMAFEAGSVLGFFGSSDFGCPGACEQSLKANIQLDYVDGRTACADTPPAMLAFSGTVRGQYEYYVMPEFSLWVHGFSSWFTQQPGKREELEQNLFLLTSGKVGPPLFPYSEESIEAYADYIMEGGLVTLWLSGSWDILPNITHPRDVEGCAFMTSLEILILIGYDLCAVGHFSSLRYVCPVGCGCSGGMTECPYGCLLSDGQTIAGFKTQAPEGNGTSPPTPTPTPTPSR